MSEITQALERAKKEPATVDAWMTMLEDEDREAIIEAIISNDVSVAEIHRVLRKLDDPFPFGLTALKTFAARVRSDLGVN